MPSLDVWGQIFSAIITTILAFYPGVAGFVAETPRHEPVTEVATLPGQDSVTPSVFEAFDDIIRTQLRADARYQQATALGALATSSPPASASVEAALVNILCTARTGENVRTITGSGAFVDDRGIILTNAHIAQFLLLTEDTADITPRCVIRQGSPALSKYEADILYISLAWITNNAHQLSDPKPSGTGEHDFALLYITEAFEGALPETFPALTLMAQADVFDHMEVRAAGYPAEILTPDDSRAPLVPSIATTSITHLFTFGSGEIDLVAIAPSVVGKPGSSGGPVVDERGAMVGLITTRGNPQGEGTQSLRALTLLYVNRILTEETGLDLAHTLSGDIRLRAQTFRETIAPHLRSLLLSTLR